jgi:ribosomal protein S10
MAQGKIRIRLKGYDHQQLDRSARQIVDTAQKTIDQLMRLDLPAGIDIEIKL